MVLNNFNENAYPVNIPDDCGCLYIIFLVPSSPQEASRMWGFFVGRQLLKPKNQSH
jgi:hypothetical protein